MQGCREYSLTLATPLMNFGNRFTARHFLSVSFRSEKDFIDDEEAE